MTTLRTGLGCMALGLVLVVAAVAIGLFRPREMAGTVRLPAPAGVLPSWPVSQGAQVSRPAVAAPARTDRIRLPRLHLDAPIVPVRLIGSTMQVPRDPGRVGWWRDGSVPGGGRGSAVLVGHVNYAGTPGAFAVLPRVRSGDRIVLTRPEVRFRVVAVRTYPKTSGIPAATFARVGPAQLVLITCGGAFDPTSGNYEDNVVVYAVQG